MFEVQVGTARPVVLNIELVPTTTELKEVVITQQPFQRTVESPLSVRTIGSAEIMRNPGGNRDISRVIRSLPGVSCQHGGEFPNRHHYPRRVRTK